MNPFDRIGIDLDYTVLSPELLACVYMLSKKYGKVSVETSPSGWGHHVLIDPDRNYSDKTKLDIREELFDDEKRIKHSRRNLKRGWVTDIMFTAKCLEGRVWMSRPEDMGGILRTIVNKYINTGGQ